MPSSNTSTPSSFLFDLLVQRAVSLGYDAIRNPLQLVQTRSRADKIAPEVGVPSQPPFDQVTSREDQGLLIDCCSVLIAQFSDAMDHAARQSKLAAQQRRAVIALTWMEPVLRSDLNLFILGPPGSDDVPEWVDFAWHVERNEQVCRKLVWLPPTEQDEWMQSAEAFCDRTFLARPWRAQPYPSTEPRLDPLSHLAEGDPLMARWLAVIEKTDDADGELIDSLVEAWVSHEVEPPHVPS
jgi:hypothetical protein